MDQEFTESDGPILAGVEIPEPVFFCSIESDSIMTQTALDKALICLQREDPSFKVNLLLGLKQRNGCVFSSLEPLGS